jgi:hypothetical protein
MAYFMPSWPTRPTKPALLSSPFEIVGPVKLFATSSHIRAREGVFVVYAGVESPLDQVLPTEQQLIPAAKKGGLRFELFRLGFHASSPFPDLDGLSARLKWQHQVSP